MKHALLALISLFMGFFVPAFSHGQTLPPPSNTQPMAHWSFDEGVGTLTSDSVGGHHGTLTNGPVWQSLSQCVSGSCLYFDGVNDSVVTASSAAFFNIASGQSLTVEVWFRTNRNASAEIIDKGDVPGQVLAQWSLSQSVFDTAGHTRPLWETVSNQHVSGTVTPSSTKSYNDNLWHHLYAVLDGQNKVMQLYIDGVKAGQRALSVAPQITNNYSLVFGAAANGTASFFKGYIDEISIYNGVVIPNPKSTPSPPDFVSPHPSPVVSPFPTPPPGWSGSSCGSSCSNDGDCTNPSTSGAVTWCNPATNLCENRFCPAGKTIAGAQCNCATGLTCGQSCVGGKTCADGVSRCGFVTPPLCVAGSGTPVEFCLPLAAHNGYGLGVCNNINASYLIGTVGQTGIPPLSQQDVWAACMPQGSFASPSPISSTLPTPVPSPLMCIGASCTSNTVDYKYGSHVSCSMTPITNSLETLSYEGQCHTLRGGTTIETVSLTPTLPGSPVFQPFILSHASADLNCMFRVCTTNAQNVPTCSPWGQ